MAELQVSEDLIEEIQQAFTEGEFNSRWALIETYHHVGTLLIGVRAERTQLLQHVALQVGRSVRTLWYCVKFAELFPDLNALPEGKNTSMRAIINKHLTTSKEEACQHPLEKIEIISFKICKECGKHLGKVENP